MSSARCQPGGEDGGRWSNAPPRRSSRERTPEGYTNLLGRAGLSLQRIVPTPSQLSVVEAVAA